MSNKMGEGFVRMGSENCGVGGPEILCKTL